VTHFVGSVPGAQATPADGLDTFAYFEPEYIRKYETFGKAVHVDEGAKLNVDTKVIPEAR